MSIIYELPDQSEWKVPAHIGWNRPLAGEIVVLPPEVSTWVDIVHQVRFIYKGG